jgi:hypothetical protein
MHAGLLLLTAALAQPPQQPAPFLPDTPRQPPQPILQAPQPELLQPQPQLPAQPQPFQQPPPFQPPPIQPPLPRQGPPPPPPSPFVPDRGCRSLEDGWWFGVELDLLKPHDNARLHGNVTRPDGSVVTVASQPSSLEWTVSPSFEVGYRLPQGLGGFALTYRFLADEGTHTITDAAGRSANLKSRINFNVWDFDYVSARFEPSPRWEIQWRLGIRAVTHFFDVSTSEDTFQLRPSNYFTGVGPHAAVEADRELALLQGFALMARLDGAVLLDNDKQRYYDTTIDPVNGNQTAVLAERHSQTAEMLRAELGLRYTPPAWEEVHFSTGYVVEYWWGLAGGNGTSLNMVTQGIFFRGQIDF